MLHVAPDYEEEDVDLTVFQCVDGSGKFVAGDEAGCFNGSSDYTTTSITLQKHNKVITFSLPVSKSCRTSSKTSCPLYIGVKEKTDRKVGNIILTLSQQRDM